jgi:hypothetical protein
MNPILLKALLPFLKSLTPEQYALLIPAIPELLKLLDGK